VSDDPPQPSRHPSPYRSFHGRSRVLDAAVLGADDAEAAAAPRQATAGDPEERPEDPVA
jgi:hypothetical protein